MISWTPLTPFKVRQLCLTGHIWGNGRSVVPFVARQFLCCQTRRIFSCIQYLNHMSSTWCWYILLNTVVKGRQNGTHFVFWYTTYLYIGEPYISYTCFPSSTIRHYIHINLNLISFLHKFVKCNPKRLAALLYALSKTGGCLVSPCIFLIIYFLSWVQFTSMV